MLLIDRLLEIVEIKTNGNKAKFYKKTGLSNGALDKIKYSASSKTIDNIISTFPDINKDWLLTGKGEMFLEPQQAYLKNEPQTFIAHEPRTDYNIAPTKPQQQTTTIMELHNYNEDELNDSIKELKSKVDLLQEKVDMLALLIKSKDNEIESKKNELKSKDDLIEILKQQLVEQKGLLANPK